MTKCFEGCACLRCKPDVTPEMIAAGFSEDKAMDSPLPDEVIYFSTIYRAMHASAPARSTCSVQMGAGSSVVCGPLITPEMIEAGKRAGWEYEVKDEPVAAEEIYRAMHAVAPVSLVSEAEDRVVTLLRERDELRLELGRLHDLLAQRPAPVPDTPKPAADFTRDFGGDRRRMGG